MAAAPSPHDALFRRVFSDPANAADELRHVLPPAIASVADWSTLQVCRGSWVDARLRSWHADLLCSVELAGRPSFLYALLEHKSWPDPFTPLQLLGYVVRIWRGFRRQHPGATRLPPIVPVVVHHSESGWRAPNDLVHLLDIAPELWSELGPFVPDFRFVLDDLAAATEKEIAERAMSALGRLALFCLKRVRHSRDVCGELGPWVAAMRAALAAPSGADALTAVLWYILSVADANAASPQQLDTLLAEIGPAAQEAGMTTIADKLRQEGHAEGKAEGKAEGRAELLLRQMTVRFGPVPAAIGARVQGASPAQIDAWAERILSARSLDELLAP